MESYQKLLISDRDYAVIIAETLTIRKAIHMGTPKIIFESDSQMAIKSILGQSPAPQLIRNLAEDTRSLTITIRIFYSVIVIGNKIYH